MECNRDEAVRARDIASMKFSKGDFYGAKEFVLKARKICPTLEGLSQMLHVLEVQTVAQSKLGDNKMDWYGILQVDPGADDSTIREQYRKLALVLHPDKNTFVGAEAAFILVGEAWGILSDKEKRAQHDMERNTFWTTCSNCQKKYPYQRTYENSITRCYDCKHIFVIRDFHRTTASQSHGNEETMKKKEIDEGEIVKKSPTSHSFSYFSNVAEAPTHPPP